MDEPSQLVQTYATLRRLLVAHFNESEVRDLCFDLGIDYDALSGQDKNGKIREIIRHVDHRAQLPQLLATCTVARPEMPWPALPNPVVPGTSPSLAEGYFSKGMHALIIGNLWEAQRYFAMTLAEDRFYPRAAEYQDKVRRLLSHSGSTTMSPTIETVDAPILEMEQLRKLLESRCWKEADEETFQILLIVADREHQGWFRHQDIERIPCVTLKLVDKLWVESSNNHFGFGAHKTVWHSLGIPVEEFTIHSFRKFGETVGWRVDGEWVMDYKNLTFKIDAPKGHLPSLRSSDEKHNAVWLALWYDNFKALLSRTDTCLATDKSS